MAAVAICSDFGAPQNKVCHCFHCFPIYLPWRWRSWSWTVLWRPIRPSRANTQKNVLFIIGDWNAKAGSQEIPGGAGKFVLGVQNEAEQRLTEFCQENALIIANSKHQSWYLKIGDHYELSDIFHVSFLLFINILRPGTEDIDIEYLLRPPHLYFIFSGPERKLWFSTFNSSVSHTVTFFWKETHHCLQKDFLMCYTTALCFFHLFQKLNWKEWIVWGRQFLLSIISESTWRLFTSFCFSLSP